MSERTVFYAWQSDHPPKCNQYFIRDAIREALHLLAEEMSVQDAPRLDHDTKDVPGTPDIAKAIFGKIEQCDVFVADVSLVGSTTPETQDKAAKRLPNPNVMIELGYALKAVSDERVIQVMNTAFGGPNDLPFDLRNRRYPIQYNLASGDALGKPNVMKKLTDDLKRAIRAILEHAPRESVQITDVAAREQAAADKFNEQQRAFEYKALQGQFHDVAPPKGVILLAIKPDTPLEPSLDLGDSSLRTLQLRTIAPSTQFADVRGGYILVQLRSGTSQVVQSVTEISRDGSVFAADGVRLGSEPSQQIVQSFDGKISGFVPDIAFEKDIILTVHEYLSFLIKSGAKLPIRVCVRLFRVRGYVLYAGPFAHIDDPSARIYAGDSIEPDTVVFQAKSELASRQDVARQLRPMFDFIWREFGYAKSGNYDESGDWSPHER